MSENPIVQLRREAETRIRKKQDLTEHLRLIWIDKPEGYTFKPGQYCTIGIDGIERAYSIASAPHEDSLELFIELLPEGEFTPKLWELKVRDSVTIRPRAKGIFTFEPDYPNHLLVATGTGVAPYISYIRECLHRNRNGRHFYVLHGASHQDQFAHRKELRQLEAVHPDLITFVPTISRPNEDRNEGWTGETGRVNTIFEKYVKKFGLTPEDTLVYTCGNPGMIEDVKARVIPRGFTVKEERFWKED